MDFDYSFEVITPDNTGSITIGGLGSLVIPKGATSDRPAAPSAGATRFNTTLVKSEIYNGSTWDTIASEAYVLANSANFTAQTANKVFAGPIVGSAIPSFRTLSLSAKDISDVVITSPTLNNILSYDGTDWVNTATTPTSSSGLLSGWVIASGNLYYSDYTHNLGTKDVVILLYNNVTGAVVEADSIVLTDIDTVRVTVYGNSTQIRIVVIANGLSVLPTASVYSVNGRVGPVTLTSADVNLSNVSNEAQVVDGGGTPSIREDLFANRPAASTPGALFLATDSKVLYRDTGSTWDLIFASSGVVRTLTYFANSLDSPNTADFAVNALAPTISDPLNTALNVRSFSNTIEQGVSVIVPIPTGAVTMTIRTKGRAQTAPISAAAVQNRVFIRSINNNAAVGAWSAGVDLTTVVIPTNNYYQYNSQTFTLSSLGLVVGGLYQMEFTRKTTVAAGTNLAYPWLLIEFTLEFA